MKNPKTEAIIKKVQVETLSKILTDAVKKKDPKLLIYGTGYFTALVNQGYYDEETVELFKLIGLLTECYILGLSTETEEESLDLVKDLMEVLK